MNEYESVFLDIKLIFVSSFSLSFPLSHFLSGQSIGLGSPLASATAQQYESQRAASCELRIHQSTPQSNVAIASGQTRTVC